VEEEVTCCERSGNKTQVDIAKALNVGQDTISRYEQRTVGRLTAAFQHQVYGLVDALVMYEQL